MNAVWCAAYLLRDERGRLCLDGEGRPRLGWCATRDGKGFTAASHRVATKCDYFIILPCGKKKRIPTCPDCARRLAN